MNCTNRIRGLSLLAALGLAAVAPNAFPVVESLGIGWFGAAFGWQFALTVTMAHIAYGATLGCLASRLTRHGAGAAGRNRDSVGDREASG